MPTTSTIYEMDMANLFAGDDDPTNSQHLTLEQVKLPVFQEKTKDHTPGGGIIGLKIGMRVFEPLVLTFKLRGFNPRVMNRFGINSPKRHKYTVRGNVRNMRDGDSFAGVAVIEGRMIKVEGDEWKRDDGISHDYEIAEIVHYKLLLNNEEKFYFDFFAGATGWRVDGKNEFETEARNLGLS